MLFIAKYKQPKNMRKRMWTINFHSYMRLFKLLDPMTSSSTHEKRQHITKRYSWTKELWRRWAWMLRSVQEIFLMSFDIDITILIISLLIVGFWWLLLSQCLLGDWSRVLGLEWIDILTNNFRQHECFII